MIKFFFKIKISKINFGYYEGIFVTLFSYSHTDFYFWFVLMFVLTTCVKIFFCCFLIIAVITWIFSTFMTFPFILLKSLYCIELFITYVTLMFLFIRIWYFMLIEGLFYLKCFITLITVISYWFFLNCSSR